MENKTDRRRTRGKDTLIKKEVEELIKYGCDDYIIQHGLLVMNVSDTIVKELKRVGVDIDEKSILRGAILHDIGRSKEHSVRHGFLGGEILKKDGYDRKVIKIVENHVGGGIDKQECAKLGMPERDFIPTSLEEKIVCLADKYVEDNQIKPLQETLSKFDEILGEGNKANKRILKIKKEIELLAKKGMESIIN
ncbi:MAG: HD domain-containing protein [Nitrososphaeria archaeon]|jgi:uncharacterized protein